MQDPTCTHIRVRSPADAHTIFHAVSEGILPMVTRRLDTEERRAIKSGCVYVWEERGPNTEATGLGIERWTDSCKWGPSRVRDEFLFYHEKDPQPVDAEITSDSDTSRRQRLHHPRGTLIKQTYSAFVATPRGRRKWHMIAYFTQESLGDLRSIDDIPQLATLTVPPSVYKSARTPKGPKVREEHALEMSRLGEEPGLVRPFGGQSSQFAGYPRSQYASRPYENGGSWPYSWDGNGQRAGSPHSSNSSSRSVDGGAELAPLAYLQRLSPRRRHPVDESALMSFGV